MSYYNELGDEVEGVLPPEEAEALKGKITELEAKAAQAETLETELNETKEALKSFEAKDYNFSNLRGKTQSEKEELLKDFSEKEKAMMLKIDSLEGKINENETQTITAIEKDVLNSLAGDDEDLKSKLKEYAKDIALEGKTKEEIQTKYRRAMAILRDDLPEMNPINQYIPSSANQIPSEKKKDFTKTPQGEALYKQWFPNIASANKSNQK